MFRAQGLAVIIQFTKRTDGGALLRCIRADGSTTWQRQDDDHAAFFPLHDLTHYAVETDLGFRRGFYGLIAEGWDIAETTGKSARGAIAFRRARGEMESDAGGRDTGVSLSSFVAAALRAA